jgi:hypothetical protein
MLSTGSADVHVRMAQTADTFAEPVDSKSN